MEYTDNCPFCGTKAKHHTRQGVDDDATTVHFYNCNGCGKFLIDGCCENLNKDMTAAYLHHKKKISFDNNGESKYFWLRRSTTPEQLRAMNEINEDYPEQWKIMIVTNDEIENWWPKTFKDKIDKILLALYRSMKYDGETIKIENGEALFICNSNKESHEREREIHYQIEFIKKYLNENELAECPSTSLINARVHRILLLPKGLEKIYEMDNQGKKQCFVAMWFPEEEDPEYDFMCSVEKAIYKAIEDNGFEAMRIDKKEHNNQIVPEILFEIKNSRFMVADFTGNRHGVYYEAGIMEGLDRDVIACSRKSDFEKIHFDIKQKSTIIYETTEELYNRLYARIRATIEGAKGNS